MALHNKLGNWGEQVVVDYLVARGYAIADRNWRLNHLEIDIIATKDCQIAFVEVKTRRNPDENPLQAISQRKISNLCTAANAYLRTRQVRLQPRFDVASVNGTPDHYTLAYLPDAFRPPLRTYH